MKYSVRVLTEDVNGGAISTPSHQCVTKEYFYPVQLVPYGNYLMPCGREAYLDFYYSKSWRTKCRGWLYGKKDALTFIRLHFVFTM